MWSGVGKMGVMACLVAGSVVAASRAANPDDGNALERANERPQEIPLWPEGRMTSLSEPEKVVEKSKDPAKQDRRIFNVSIPTIAVYRPASTSTNASVPAVVICPGGAYGGLAFDIEGSDVARWLNSLGIAGVVLKYRVPMAKDDGKHRLPLQDAQRALSIVRSRAAEWSLDPQRIGIMGFSAGGHLAVNACNNHEGRAYDPSDAVDQTSCRPDFAILVYPAYLAPKSPGPDLYPEIKVTSNTPPTFLVHAEDDPISVENSLFYYLALKKANVPAQMVLYAKGGHGYGLGVRGGPVAGWPNACRLWMEDQGIAARGGERTAGSQVQQNSFSVRSPDGAVAVRLERASGWQVSVWRGDHEVLPASPVGITLKQGGTFPGVLTVTGTRTAVINEAYAMPVGKRSHCRNQANELVVEFGEGQAVKFSLILRAYNEGVAYRYQIHGQGKDAVSQELTAFVLPQKARIWCEKYQPHYQSVYAGRHSLDELAKPYHLQFPLLFQTPAGPWGYITEAAVDGSYGGARLRLTDVKKGVFQLCLEGKTEGSFPWVTPWRVIFAVKNLGQLVESTLVSDLAPPSRIADTSWIKPGVASFPWLAGLAINGRFHYNQGNFERLKKFVDVAAELQWPWIEFDSGMEGWPALGGRSAKECPWMKDLVQYAAAKNVSVYGWEIVKYFATPEDRAKYYDWLIARGFKGVKVDFLDSDSQARYQYREDVARECAERKLLVSFHGDVLPRGMQRTWPNIVTQEGVAGEEHYYFHRALGPLTPAHNVNLVFTRNVPGSMDYTPACIEWDGRGFRKTTCAHEMALPVVYESGWTSMGLSPESVQQPAGKTAAEFLKGLPAAWDDIRFLAGAPDEFAVVARRKGADWWIAGINAGTARTLSLTLDFLKPGPHTAKLYHDDPATIGKPPVETLITVTPVTVDEGHPLTVDVPANGGFGIMVRE